MEAKACMALLDDYLPVPLTTHTNHRLIMFLPAVIMILNISFINVEVQDHSVERTFTDPYGTADFRLLNKGSIHEKLISSKKKMQKTL